MADELQFSLIGVDSLIGKLDSISQEVRFKGGRFAIRKAAKIVLDAAKANALRIDDPETGRVIADNIAMRWGSRRFKRTGDLSMRIGVYGRIKDAAKGNPDAGKGGPTNHAMLVELGTKYARAQPYLRPALSQNISGVTSTFVIDLEKAIDRAIRRAAKKAAKI